MNDNYAPWPETTAVRCRQLAEHFHDLALAASNGSLARRLFSAAKDLEVRAAELAGEEGSAAADVA